MWGKVISRLNLCCCRGITPTHVGKSLQYLPAIVTEQDHPHPCGEKNAASDFEACRLGSPPPMWGKASLQVKDKKIVRITPTHVGKS